MGELRNDEISHAEYGEFYTNGKFDFIVRYKRPYILKIQHLMCFRPHVVGFIKTRDFLKKYKLMSNTYL